MCVCVCATEGEEGLPGFTVTVTPMTKDVLMGPNVCWWIIEGTADTHTHTHGCLHNVVRHSV